MWQSISQVKSKSNKWKKFKILYILPLMQGVLQFTHDKVLQIKKQVNSDIKEPICFTPLARTHPRDMEIRPRMFTVGCSQTLLYFQ